MRITKFFFILVVVTFVMIIMMINKLPKLENPSSKLIDEPFCSKTHIFYYIWYKNLDVDKKWSHWNHVVLPHWQSQVNSKYPQIGSKFQPENDDIGANFFPERGLYSSSSENTTFEQFKELSSIAGVQVIVVSWWGISSHDEQGDVTEELMPMLFKVAEKVGVKIIFHLEPYKDRTALSTLTDIKYIIDKYSNLPAFFKTENGKPMFYVYDSYLIKAEEWATILSPNGKNTIRGTKYDSVMISLYLDKNSEKFILNSHFDGIYTYFASKGFTYGSNPQNWKLINKWCKENGKIFIPCVGPGYDDTRIRPWNSINKKDRNQGKYYDEMWKEAVDLKVDFVAITSYNEWHEGSQIEPAIPKISKTGFKYEDYGSFKPDYYLQATKKWVKIFDTNC